MRRRDALRRPLKVAAAKAGEDGLAAQLGKIAKRVQGALPIVGLLSRLASPSGGFDAVVSAHAR